MKRKSITKESHSKPGSKPALKLETKPFIRKYYVVLIIILTFTYILYSPILNNGFVWDDSKYIVNNSLNKDLSWNGIKAIFSSLSSHNYAPVTDLINTVQYSISGLSPAAFHFGSLLTHLLNIILVFWFIKTLCGNWNIAAVTALIFGIHPVQVESVAWASGGSTLYFTAFFLGSLIAYLYYLRDNLKKYLVISLMLFILSLLAKAMAVMLPVVLVIIYYFRNKTITKKALIEMGPFFILALAVGILSVSLRDQQGVTDRFTTFSFGQRIVFASYGFVMYLVKLVLPVNLSAFYPYPIKSDENIPFLYYFFPVIFLAFVAFVIYSLRFSKKIFFGAAFFAITLFTVSQLFPVGGTIMADRYIYLSSVGIFYLAAEGLNLIWNGKLKWAAILLLGVFTVFFSVKTYSRNGVWKNDMTLWNDVIGKFQNIPYAYNNRGLSFVEIEKFNEAISDFTDAVRLKPDYTEAWFNRGLCYVNKNLNNEALNDFKKAIELEPGDPEAYYNCGVLLMKEERNDEALINFNKTVSLKDDYTEAYINRANIFLETNRYDEALRDYNRAVELQPDNHLPFLNRGILLSRMNRTGEAKSDYARVIELKPDSFQVYNLLGNIYFSEKNYAEAINAYSKAIAQKADFGDAFYNRGLAEYNQGNTAAAIADFKQAAKHGNLQANEVLRTVTF